MPPIQFIGKLEKDKKKEQCQIIFKYIKATCHPKSTYGIHKREYFTSCDNNSECIHFKAQFNHYCFMFDTDKYT